MPHAELEHPVNVTESGNNKIPSRIVIGRNAFADQVVAVTEKLEASDPFNVANRIMLYGRIRELEKLEDGWDGYGAVALKPKTIRNAINFVKLIPDKLTFLLDTDSIVPTSYGTIVFDFEQNDNLISVEIGADLIGYFTEQSTKENFTEPGIEFNERTLPKNLEKSFRSL